jgi:hypothetical protein
MKLFLHTTEFRADGDAVVWGLRFAAFECRTARNRSERRRQESDEMRLLAWPGHLHGSVPMKLVAVLICLALSTLAATPPDGERVHCNLAALSKAERERDAQLIPGSGKPSVSARSWPTATPTASSPQC